MANSSRRQQWPVLRRYVDRVLKAVDAANPGSYSEVEIPFGSAPVLRRAHDNSFPF
jgi:hypothetical protein